MALQSNFPIRMSEIQAEFSKPTTDKLTTYLGIASGIPTTVPIRVSDFLGASAGFDFEIINDGPAMNNAMITSDTLVRPIPGRFNQGSFGSSIGWSFVTEATVVTTTCFFTQPGQTTPIEGPCVVDITANVGNINIPGTSIVEILALNGSGGIISSLNNASSASSSTVNINISAFVPAGQFAGWRSFYNGNGNPGAGGQATISRLRVFST